MPFGKRHDVFRKKIRNTAFRTRYVSYIQGVGRMRMTDEEED